MSLMICSRIFLDAIRLAASGGLLAGQPSGVKAVQRSQTETAPQVTRDEVVSRGKGIRLPCDSRGGRAYLQPTPVVYYGLLTMAQL